MAQPAKDKQPAHSPEEKRQLGAQLAKAREAAGFSIAAAATELTRRGYPISKGGVGHWETGTNVPDALWLARLAKLYDTTTDALTGAEARAAWPFSSELLAKVASLDARDQHSMEVAMWAHLREDVPEAVAETAKRNLRSLGAGVKSVTPAEQAKRTA